MQVKNLADIKKLAASMTPEEKIGQVLMGMFQSSDIPKDIADLIVKKGVGIFRYCPDANYDNLSRAVGGPNRNLTPAQTAELMNELQKLAQKTRLKIPLLMSTDQEGGVESDVNRGGVTVFPGHIGFGAIGDPKITKKASEIMGKELRAMGITMVQCPVGDIVNRDSFKVCKTNTFGDRTETVIKHTIAMATGFEAGGVVSIMKHFPGYGAVSTDAHEGMSRITKSKEELEKNDIAVYSKAFKAGVRGIMVGHVIVLCLGDSENPASLSEKVITGYLRNKMKFDGFIQTDAMRMRAILDKYGVGQASVIALQAGCDGVLLRGDVNFFNEGYDAVLTAYRQGKIDKAMLDSSVKRVLKLKLDSGLFKSPFVDPKKAKKIVGCKAHRDFSMKVARKVITVARNRKSLLPLSRASSDRILVVNVIAKKQEAINDPVQSLDMLPRAIKKMHKNTSEIYVKFSTTDVEIAKARELALKADIVIAGICNAITSPGQVKLVRELLSTGKKVIVVSLQAPYDLTVLPELDTNICTFEASNDSMIALSEAIFGKLKPAGKMPVKI
jgi:beta-N-acetylhexosaminidase